MPVRSILAASAALFFATAIPVAATPAPGDAATASGQAVHNQGWLSVRITGRGPDVILLPGLSSAGAVWDGTVEALSNRYRFHVVDVAGFAGQPTGLARDGIVDGLVEDVAAYISAQGLERPVAVGHSMGGFTALRLARDHGARIGAVVSVDSLPFYPLIMDRAATPESVAPRTSAMIAQLRALPDADYNTMQSGMVTRMAKTPEAQTRIAGWSAASDRTVVLDAMAELMRTDLRPELDRITVPVTVLYAHDPVMGVPAEAVDRLYASAYSGLPDASLQRIDGSLHFIMDDQPKAFHAALETALARSFDR